MSKTIFFFHEYEDYGFLSNWYPCIFVVDDFEYLFVEQYMMAQKAKLFHDSKRYTAILRSSDPEECKKLGRLVQGYDPAVWTAARYEVVKTAIKAKFGQNMGLRKALLETEDAFLAEANPKDSIWGIGLDAETARQTNYYDWPGENFLGKILMEVRDELRDPKT